jgi:ABC-type multidrug transport system fused ATPase/permease subunit
LNKINEMQNTKQIKDALFTQKILYREMYIHKIIAFVILIIGVVVAKILDSNNIDEILISIINLVFAACFLLINYLCNNKCEFAATIQEYIDRTLFEFDIEKDSIGKFSTKEIKQKIYETIKSHKKKYEIQIEKTGDDPEHGVKDWYTNISNELNILEAINKCQMQNTWWDQEQDKIYFIFKIVFIVILSLLLYILFVDMWQIIVITILGTLIDFISLYVTYKNYKKISQEIKTLENMVDKTDIKNITILKEIQEKIFERRKTGYKVPDFIHNFKASELHKKYENIFK